MGRDLEQRLSFEVSCHGHLGRAWPGLDPDGAASGDCQETALLAAEGQVRSRRESQVESFMAAPVLPPPVESPLLFRE